MDLCKALSTKEGVAYSRGGPIIKIVRYSIASIIRTPDVPGSSGLAEIFG